MLAFNESGIPAAVASTTSPSGMVAAGQHGLGVLSLSAGFIGGKKNMQEQWAIAEKTSGRIRQECESRLVANGLAGPRR